MDSSLENIKEKWCELLENQNLYNIDGGISDNGIVDYNRFDSFLPISLQVASQTIGLDLVSVVPMDIETEDEKAERLRLIRVDTLKALVNDTEFDEKDYHKPKTLGGMLMHLDFIYGNGTADDLSKYTYTFYNSQKSILKK